MGLSVTTAAAIHGAVSGTRWGSLIVPLAVSVGYLIVILGRQGLITETAMIGALDLLSEPRLGAVRRFAALIAVVTGANLLGAFVVAAVLSATSILNPHHHRAVIEAGVRVLEPSASTIFIRAVVGGWAIAVAVWTGPAAGSAKVLMITILAYVTGLLHLTHLAAGSIEVMSVAFQDGTRWTEYLVKFLPAVISGNLLGSFALVALLNHLQVRRERTRIT